MLPSELFNEMLLLGYQLVLITHGSDFKRWEISLPQGAVVRAGAPSSAQPRLRSDAKQDVPIDPAFPVSVQVLDPLQRGGNNHAAARRRLRKPMARAGFTETEFSESPHYMHLVFTPETYAVPLDEWLAPVPPLQADFAVDPGPDQSIPHRLSDVKLPEMSFSDSPPPPPDARLEEIEQRWKLRLPDDYYMFLQQYNGGVPQRKRLRFNDSDGMNELQILHFFSVLPQGQFSRFGLEVALEAQPGHLPKHLMPIAHCEFEGQPQLLCLSVAGEERGKVVLFEQSFDAQCHVVADSITALLEELHD